MTLKGKIVAVCWVFRSSNGSGSYQTLKYTDGATSCDCPGWTRRVAADGSRTCKHTRMVDMGMADGACLSRKDYTVIENRPVSQPVLSTTHTGRRFDLT